MWVKTQWHHSDTQPQLQSSPRRAKGSQCEKPWHPRWPMTLFWASQIPTADRKQRPLGAWQTWANRPRPPPQWWPLQSWHWGRGCRDRNWQEDRRWRTAWAPESDPLGRHWWWTPRLDWMKMRRRSERRAQWVRPRISQHLLDPKLKIKCCNT